MIRFALLILGIFIGSLAHEGTAQGTTPATMPAIVTLPETVITVNVGGERATLAEVAPMESDLFRGADLLPTAELLQAIGVNAGVYCDAQIYQGETVNDEFHTVEDCHIEIDDRDFVQPFGFPGTGSGDGK